MELRFERRRDAQLSQQFRADGQDGVVDGLSWQELHVGDRLAQEGRRRATVAPVGGEPPRYEAASVDRRQYRDRDGLGTRVELPRQGVEVGQREGALLHRVAL